MKATISTLSVALLLTASSLAAQVPTVSTRLAANNTDGGSYRPATTVQHGSVYGGPFSHFAIGGSFNTLGPGIQITTNLADHFNLRATGNTFRYSTNFNTNGFDANAKLSMTNAALAADIYPFHTGFRVSPGVMVLNNNRIAANAVAAGGTSFTFNDTTYYSATANAATGATPLTVNGSLGLNYDQAGVHPDHRLGQHDSAEWRPLVVPVRGRRSFCRSALGERDAVGLGLPGSGADPVRRRARTPRTQHRRTFRPVWLRRSPSGRAT